MGGPALTRPAPILYHGLQPRVKPRGVGAPRLIGLGRQGRPRLRTKAILLDRDRGNDAGMSRSVPRADRDGVAGAPPLRCGGMHPAAGGDTEFPRIAPINAESRPSLSEALPSPSSPATASSHVDGTPHLSATSLYSPRSHCTARAISSASASDSP